MTKAEIESLYRGEIAFLKEVKAQRDRSTRSQKRTGKKSVNEIIAENKQRKKAMMIPSGVLGGAFEPRLLNASQEASMLVNDRGQYGRSSKVVR